MNKDYHRTETVATFDDALAEILERNGQPVKKP
jgi:hypothetical protein